MNIEPGLLHSCHEFLKNNGLTDYRIEIEDDGVRVIDPGGREFTIDFDNNKKDYDRRNQKGGQDLLIKALRGDHEVDHVLDLSAGLGIDAVYLSQCGFRVTSLERNPVLYLMLSKALEKTERSDLKDLRFIQTDSLQFLEGLRDPLYQVAYFDPMYPEKKKSALPRKEMQIFRELVGSDQDSAEVLKKAIHQKGFLRVVVKRAFKAGELLPGVVHSFKGKTVRYDLYIPR